MKCNIRQIRSLRKYTEDNIKKDMTRTELMNEWIKVKGEDIHDPDLVEYYRELIPMIERRTKYETAN